MSPSLTFGFIIVNYLFLVFSLCVHEAAHAGMANRLGDPTARLMGRLTLNPIAHADLLGTVILPLFAMFSGISVLFGWAKPVPVNPSNLRDRKRGPMMVALAGPLSNLAIAICVALLLRAMATLFGAMEPDVRLLLAIKIIEGLMFINLVLMIFNLIPLPPLDGYSVLEYFLPYEWAKKFEQIGPYSTLILLVLVFYFRVLTVPMALAVGGMRFIAYYGTVLWQFPG
ncbi:MAG TPA: site-2 protease family protein [Candidatus Hydrogenedentes bacterium]|nr:site-2 protease family protein [Candidatus Hydrogenedentota bacterium]HPU98306.1 site-2 protease family protein [Candidatus Hydrogenedentota bacterium]